jgi:hypothetical protein
MSKKEEKPKLKGLKSARKNFTLRLSEDEKVDMQKSADEFCGGNLGEWIRIAGLKWKPEQNDLK